MSGICEVSVDRPHPALPGADWADAYEIELAGQRLSAIEAARRTLGSMPAWARRLLALRNAIGRFVGLKTGAGRSIGEGQRIGMFPILAESPRQVVLGLDDWHLDFRIVVDAVDDGNGGTRLRTTTLVRRKNYFGRLYISAVTPFHRLIVPLTLRGAL